MIFVICEFEDGTILFSNGEVSEAGLVQYALFWEMRGFFTDEDSPFPHK